MLEVRAFERGSASGVGPTDARQIQDKPGGTRIKILGVYMALQTERRWCGRVLSKKRQLGTMGRKKEQRLVVGKYEDLQVVAAMRSCGRRTAYIYAGWMPARMPARPEGGKPRAWPTIGRDHRNSAASRRCFRISSKKARRGLPLSRAARAMLPPLRARASER